MLSEDEYRATCATPMRDVFAAPEPVLDIWPYVDALALDELGIPHLNDVRYVYRDARDWYDHVGIGTGRFNTMLVVVVDRRTRSILGHFALDLEHVYGAEPREAN